MLRLLQRLLLLLAVGAMLHVSAAEIAKDLPPGTSKDTLIRAYGWPKGGQKAGVSLIDVHSPSRGHGSR